MLKSRILFAACLVIAAAVTLAGCAVQPGAAPIQPAAPGVQPNPTETNQPEDTFKVVAWVDNPTPHPGEQVNLSGSLIKNGIYLGGMMMHAAWPDKSQERGVPNCKVLVIYQRGVCIIETGDYQPGEYVPVTIMFVYNDKTFTGETGFTLR